MQARLQAGGEQAEAATGGPCAELLERRRADLPPRYVDDAQEGRVVIRIGDDAQVREHVLDLGAIEKRGPAGHRVGDFEGTQRLFERPRLEVAPIQHREVAPLAAAFHAHTHDFHGDPICFVGAVAGHEDANAVAGSVGAPQTLIEQVGVVGDESVGGRQDAAGGAVILLQLDDFQRRVIGRQAAQVVRPRAPPRVDRLVVVAHHRECAPPADQLPHELVLGEVGVLVLVAEHVLDPILPRFQHLGQLPEQEHRPHDQVVEIQRVVGLQRALVTRVLHRAGLLELVGGGRQRRLGRHQFALPGRERRTGGVDRGLGVGVVVLQQLLDQAAAVVRIEDGEAALVAEIAVLTPQDVQPQRVKG